MNSKEHKREAERLIEAVHTQIGIIEKHVSERSVNTVTAQVVVSMLEVTGQLAQVHATLARVPDEQTLGFL